MTSILLVEDTYDIGDAIKEYLTLSGFDVVRVTHIEEAYSMLKKHRFDCAIIDRMLPDGEGIHLCQEIKSFHTFPVIMSTAKGQIDDKVVGFGSGADDYLTKPFDLKELELRINSLIRRNTGSQGITHWKDIVIDKEKQQIFKDGTVVNVSNKEFLIIIALLEQHGSSISRTDLLETIWGDEAIRDNDNKLDVYVSTIRKKLGKDFIETIKGFGYRIGI